MTTRRGISGSIQEIGATWVSLFKPSNPIEPEDSEKKWMTGIRQLAEEEEKKGSMSANIKLTLMNSTRTHWVPNRSAKQCYKWFKDFGFFRRRHHCRICGNVFCSSCCDKRRVNYSQQLRYFRSKPYEKRDKADEINENAPIRICDK